MICGLSGGVDSSVTAILLHEAIGDQLTCVFVDHGLLRLNEATEVVKMFRDNYNIKLIAADESDLFLSALEGVSDPEVKRKTIGACSSTYSRNTPMKSRMPNIWPRARFTPM